jgi:hypothetical protein
LLRLPEKKRSEVLAYFGKYGLHSGAGAFTRTYWLRARDMEGNLSPRPADSISVRLTAPTIFGTRFSMRAVADTAVGNPCRDTVALALDAVSSPDGQVRIKWSAKGYFRIPQGMEETWENQIDSLGVSVGAPHRDTLHLTWRILDSLNYTGSPVAFDSVLITADLSNQGDLIRSVTVPVRVDSLGCFHPSPAREEWGAGVPDSIARR